MSGAMQTVMAYRFVVSLALSAVVGTVGLHLTSRYRYNTLHTLHNDLDAYALAYGIPRS